MVKSRFFVTLISATALAATLIVAGCHHNASPDGVYSDSTGQMNLEFKDGKAHMNVGSMADTAGSPYDVSGEKITIHTPAGDVQITMNSDGSLQTPTGVLTKK
jgi:hypothetical protein